MFSVFGRSAQVSPYELAPAQIDLQAKNTPKSPGAKESMSMDFSEYDQSAHPTS